MAEVTLWLSTGPSGSGIEISIEELARMCNLDIVPESVVLRVKDNNLKLEATANTREHDYPGIDIDGYDANDEQMYLGGFELPNEGMPETLTARLYAGYGATETDEPIALVMTELQTAEQLEEAMRRFEITHRVPVKNVYVDPNGARAQDWVDMESLKEHAE